MTTVVMTVSAPLVFAQGNIPVEATDDADAVTNISSEQMTGRPDRELMLDDKVEINRGGTTMHADHATYWVVDDEVEATGNVTLSRFGDRYTGDKMRFKMDTGVGYALNPTYFLKESNGQGRADRIDFESREQATITDGTYSTCEGPNPDWYLQANTMDLDTGREMGTTGTTIVYFKGVPIIGTPYLSFPLSNARKSGVLPPSIGSSSKGGLEVSVPYYFNIAPNRDLVLTPTYITRRGLQLGGDARYLGYNYAGETKFEYLPDDQQTQTNRWSLSSQHLQRLSPRLSFAWNVNAASDDDYPDDFSRNLATSTQRLLLRDLSTTYAGNFWSATARVSGYQVLQDINSTIIQPYDRLPQLSLHAGRYDDNGFDWSTDVQATRFWHADFVPSTSILDTRVRGDRFTINPKISYPIIRPEYFVKPQISLHATSYNVTNPATDVNSNYSMVVPTFSLDSGLIFERETSFFGKAATQTLEPRLFYVNTPYRDQSQFPVFDSAEADLSFAQIFSENRFIGNDRVGDANQLTAALVSRYIEEDGAERLRVAVGQRFYFEDQRVQIPRFDASGQPLPIAPRDESKSDFLASASLRVSDELSTEGNLQYSATEKNISRANYGVSWKPAPKKVLNLTYRRDLANELRQVDVSGQWPLSNRWYGVGRINYSLEDGNVSEGILGLEYKADCWIFRMVAQRTPTSTGEANTSLFFQLELSGLARLGSDPLEALRQNVTGYQILSNAPNEQ